MKRIFLLALLCLAVPVAMSEETSTVPTAAAFDHSHAEYDRILKTYVISGRVDYAGLTTHHADLRNYLDALGTVSEATFRAWTKEQQMTFLFNLYNGTTLSLVVQHGNRPIQQIEEGGKGPWDQPVVPLFSKHITLNELEHEILRKQYAEPRLHMALVCAAKGCPPLRNEAYSAEGLEEQLNEQSRAMLADPLKFRIDKEEKIIYLSPIFKWYGRDFVDLYGHDDRFKGLSPKERATVAFCFNYLPGDAQAELLAHPYKVRFLGYDWSLNDTLSPATVDTNTPPESP